MRSAAENFSRIREPGVANRVWIRTPTRVIRYTELADRVRRMAGLLRGYDVRQGDRVLFATRDDAEAALLFVSLLINGVVAVNVDADTGPERAVALTERSDPALLILDSALRERWQIRSSRPCIEISAEKPAKLLASFRAKAASGSFHDLLGRASPEDPPDHIAPETLAYILFTSGTTRHPKGVCISHRALFSHLETLSSVYKYGPASAILNTLMLSHADGMIQGPVISFYNAATLHRPQMFEITTLESLLDHVYQLRITHMVAVPTMLALMTRLSEHQSDAFQGGDFQLLICCGAALEEKLWQSAEQKFGVSVINVYGLTETVVGGVFAGQSVGIHRRDQIGRPIDCELRIIDDAGADLAGGPGELLIKGDLVMSGYFDDQSQTQQVLRDGWLHTGDIAVRHEDGGYSICGRKKNIVIRGGYNIHPEEIAEVLMRCPNVRDVIAFGIPDADWGEKLVAMVEADTANEQDLLEQCKAALEPRKVPSRVVVVDALPKGRSGKVVIEAARSLFQELTQSGGSAPRSTPKSGARTEDCAAAVLAIASRCFRVDPAQLQMSSTAKDVIGWDSLAHMEFIVALEKEFGVHFSPRDVMGLDSLEKALARILAG
jgi:long-chain acyl-CoA synthetase